MRVLITGSGGQVGHELIQAFADHDVIATPHSELDVSDRDAVIEAVRASNPNVILHAAAWTAVDACEEDPDRAFAVNALGTRYVAEAAGRVNARVVYFSTDYVFDGTKTEPYTEADATNPQSVYGQSKLAGEREIARRSNALIVRLSWVCGFHGQNMVKTILRLADEHDKLQFVDDQRGRLTFAEDAAAMVRQLIDNKRAGIFHVSNGGAVSWYEFARSVMESAGLDPERVQPIATADLQPARPAPRPANSVLENAALRQAGLPPMPPYRESLDRLVARLVTA
ncbi:MAG: dTDP-4-dehydrorhamnose reductase [Acidimicrobiia bacterium]|nr:dTDP-4-dehydrorhamnose reductase [Acidimicrobiia bacterium]